MVRPLTPPTTRPTAASDLYQRTFHASPVGMAINALDGRFIDINECALSLFGLRRDEVIGRTSIELGLVEDATAESQRAFALRLQEQGQARKEYRTVRTSSGELRDVALSVDTIDLGGEPCFLSTFLDISEQRRAAQMLAASEARLERAQELAQLGSWDWDLRTDTVTRSKELCRIFGMTEADFGTSVTSSYDRVHPDDRARLQAAIQSAKGERQPWALEYRIIRPDGIRVVYARGEVVSDGGGNPVRMVGTAQDITERRNAEARLVFADRMASVGTLAAGVAHEINNPLSYVISHLDLIAEDLHADSSRPSQDEARSAVIEMINAARDGAERVRRIVRSLKTFSRADEDRRALLDVRRVVDLSIDMTYTEIRYRARLVKDYADVPPVDADESRLAQVFINLLINAAHAIPEGQPESNEIRVCTRTDSSGRAVVEVHDTGCGMVTETLRHIFDPFFTTKPVGAGTGLGLSICHGIVTALGGTIGAQSEPGKGSLFRLVLPPGRLAPPPVEAPSAVSRPTPRRRGRVLVIDDEAMVGAAVARILRDQEVIVATMASDGLARLVAGERFDVILCDVMMPQMTGMDLHAEVSRTSPDLLDHIVFMTGGAFTPVARAFLDRVPNVRVDKPFNAQNLRAIVDRFLLQPEARSPP
jgi:PAS domain S-box-containing protein